MSPAAERRIGWAMCAVAALIWWAAVVWGILVIW
jgi:hypothetical protein